MLWNTVQTTEQVIQQENIVFESKHYLLFSWVSRLVRLVMDEEVMFFLSQLLSMLFFRSYCWSDYVSNVSWASIVLNSSNLGICLLLNENVNNLAHTLTRYVIAG